MMIEEVSLLDDINDELFKVQQKIINYWKNKYKEKCKECEDLECDKEELEYEVEILKEKIEIIERDRDDNYRPIPMSVQLDISDRDFC